MKFAFISKIPTKYYTNKQKKGKIFLKNAILKDFDTSFIFRKKQGFGTPIGDFIDHLDLNFYTKIALNALEISTKENLFHKNKFSLFSLGYWIENNT